MALNPSCFDVAHLFCSFLFHWFLVSCYDLVGSLFARTFGIGNWPAFCGNFASLLGDGSFEWQYTRQRPGSGTCISLRIDGGNGSCLLHF